MDSELRLLSSLLCANDAEKSLFWEKQLPLRFFRTRQSEAAWVYRVRERTGAFPSLEALAQRFPDDGIAEVTDHVSVCMEPVLANVAYHEIKQVLDKTSEMFNRKDDPTKIVETFRALAGKVSSFATSYVDEDLSDPQVAMRRYQELSRARGKSGSYIDSPWPPLNKLINFVRPGEVFTITARTSLGKSWILLYWANHIAKTGRSTFVLSKEMSSSSVADRLTAIRYELDWERFRAGMLSVGEQVQWKVKALRAKRQREPYSLIVSGEETLEGTGLEHLYAKVAQTNAQVIMVDGGYLLTNAALGPRASPVEQATSVSRAMKRLAKATNTQVFVVNQMNREAENKQGVAKGTLANVYGSDAWAQDSDYLLEVSGERGSDERVLRLLKSRETGIGDLYVNFKLSPRPDFSPKTTLSSSAMAGIKFKVIP